MDGGQPRCCWAYLLSRPLAAEISALSAAISLALDGTLSLSLSLSLAFPLSARPFLAFYFSLSLSLSLCFSCCTYITSFHYATASHRRSGHPAATRRSRARQTCITNHLIVSSPNGQYSHGLRLQKERRRESQRARARERERERERGRVISAGIGRYKNAKSGPPIRHLRSRPGSDSEGWGRVLETKRFALQGVMVCYTRRLVQTHTRHPGPPTRRARSGK